MSITSSYQIYLRAIYPQVFAYLNTTRVYSFINAILLKATQIELLRLRTKTERVKELLKLFNPVFSASPCDFFLNPKVKGIIGKDY